MPNQTLADSVRGNGGLLILLGGGLVLCGFVAMGSPAFTGTMVTIMIGSMIVLGGILQTVFAIKTRSGATSWVRFVAGLLTLIAGVVVLSNPLATLAFLTLLLVGYFLVLGVTEMAVAWQLRPLPGWAWAFFSGLMSVILAILIWKQWPVSGLWAVGLLVGIKILFTGVSLIAIGVAARTLVRDVR